MTTHRCRTGLPRLASPAGRWRYRRHASLIAYYITYVMRHRSEGSGSRTEIRRQQFRVLQANSVEPIRGLWVRQTATFCSPGVYLLFQKIREQLSGKPIDQSISRSISHDTMFISTFICCRYEVHGSLLLGRPKARRTKGRLLNTECPTWYSRPVDVGTGYSPGHFNRTFPLPHS